VYECTGPAGDRILTDDPRTLKNCIGLKGDPATPPSRSSASEGQPPAAQDNHASDSMEPGTPAESAQVPDPPIGRSSPAPPMDPEYGPPPHIVAPATKTCTKGINPLNPFGSAPCQPRPGIPPVSVPYEDFYR